MRSVLVLVLIPLLSLGACATKPPKPGPRSTAERLKASCDARDGVLVQSAHPTGDAAVDTLCDISLKRSPRP